MDTTSHTHHHAVSAHVPVGRSGRAPLRIAAAAAAGLVVLTAVSASAANLGPQGITAPTLGAATKTIASCDNDGVTVGYTPQYLSANAQYNVASVAITGIDANCAGRTLSITLSDSAGLALPAPSPVLLSAATTGANPLPVSFGALLVPAASVTGVAIVIA